MRYVKDATKENMRVLLNISKIFFWKRLIYPREN